MMETGRKRTGKWDRGASSIPIGFDVYPDFKSIVTDFLAFVLEISGKIE